MLEIVIKKTKVWDELNEIFIDIPETKLQLEHSLLSLSKWESIHHKPYLSKKTNVTQEEQLDYIRCMTINKNINPYVFYCLTEDNVNDIVNYINDPRTATKIIETNAPSVNKIITSEQIYSWMISLNIPFECEKWHINRLITLIKVCSANNAPKRKISKNALAKEYARLNAERCAKLKTRG